MNDFRRRLGVVLFAVALAFSMPARAFDDAAASRVLNFAQQRLAATAAVPTIPGYPKATLPDGNWSLVPANDAIGWTQGFFPGALWYLYQATGDTSLRSEANRWTRPLEVQKTNRQTHDLGFKVFNSFGRAYQLTQDPYYRGVLLTTAGSLASRYNPTVGVVSCCDWNPGWRLPVVIDTMMNLELLLWGAQNGGDPAWQQMALNHARKTLQDLIRPDGSTWQVVDYDPVTGAIRSRGTFQGYSNESTWARGQAWAIYGFTMVYRYTRDPQMLDAARRTADLYLARLPPDLVPNWDFDAPEVLKDSSTAAIVASALLELSTFVTDLPTQQRYRDLALRMLDVLSAPPYLSVGVDTRAILLHGVGNRPANQEIDVGLIYGDYYFLEAVLRFNPRPPPLPDASWFSRLSFAASVRSLGTANTAQQATIEFDVTPSQPNIDGVIGWADTSTTVGSYASMSMQLRMNPSGSFDVRNGGGYAALTRVPYRGNATYHVRITANLGTRRYSVFVTPPGAAEVQIARDYAFRSDAPFINDLGKVSLKSGHVDNEFRVDRHTVNGTVAPPPQPPPPQPPPPSPTSWLGKLSFSEALHPLGPGNTGLRNIEFDLTPLRTTVDSVVGYADSSTAVNAYTRLAMLVRMNPNGFFDVRNGGAYAALTQVRYTANSTYHVRISADLNAKRYSVWVRPPGGAEIQIAANYAFRSDAPPTDDAGQVAVKAGIANDEFRVTNHTITAAAIAPPTTASPVPPPVSLGSTPAAEPETGCASAPAGPAIGGLALMLLAALGIRRLGRVRMPEQGD